MVVVVGSFACYRFPRSPLIVFVRFAYAWHLSAFTFGVAFYVLFCFVQLFVLIAVAGTNLLVHAVHRCCVRLCAVACRLPSFLQLVWYGWHGLSVIAGSFK